MGKLRLRKRKCLFKSLKPVSDTGTSRLTSESDSSSTPFPGFFTPTLRGPPPTSLGDISLLAGRQPFCMTTAKWLRLWRVNGMSSFPQISLSWAEKEKKKKGFQVYCLSKYLTNIKNSTDHWVICSDTGKSRVCHTDWSKKEKDWTSWWIAQEKGL